jgi:ubiquinone/menaquinone biosynthesis C-methylase UbiE
MFEKEYYEHYGDVDKHAYTINNFFANPDHQQRYEQLIKFIPNDAKTLIDVGCGPGSFLCYLKKRREITALGLERSSNNIEIARSLVDVPLIQADIQKCPFNDNSFDVVCCFEVLEHLPFNIYESAIKEIYRITKKWIIITVPYEEDRLFIKCPYCNATFNPTYHMRSFYQHTIENLFPDNSFVFCEKIGGIEQIIFYKFFKKLYIKHFDSGLPMFAICPSCGFHEKTQQLKEVKKNTFKRILNKYSLVIPKKKTFKWFCAIYSKNS